MRKIDERALAIIREYETGPGNRVALEAYRDPVGLWTIGWGHLIQPHERSLYLGRVITIEEAEKILLADLEWAQKAVSKYVKVKLDDGQYGALVSLVFNIGADQFKKSTLLKLLNKKDYVGASEQFGRWIYANGIRWNGLIRRREAERLLFLADGGYNPVAKDLSRIEYLPYIPLPRWPRPNPDEVV